VVYSKPKKYAVNTASKHIANIKTVVSKPKTRHSKINSYAKQITIASESDDDRYIQTLSFDGWAQLEQPTSSVGGTTKRPQMAIDWMRDWTAWRGFTRHHKKTLEYKARICI
jgi:hypothetical protein